MDLIDSLLRVKHAEPVTRMNTSNLFVSCTLPPLDELDKLITDRPESCKRKNMEPGMTRLPVSGPTIPVQPQAMATLALQCHPLHQQHHLQLQLHCQSRLGSISPAPAQTPPLHTVPDLSHSPHPQQHQARAHHDYYTLHAGDLNNEVDALDPSIMDFALQGEHTT